MTPEKWQQIKHVLDAAISLETSERSTYLDQACASDPELRQEVESLLRSHKEAGAEFLNTPAIDLRAANLDAPRFSSRVGRRIGVYQVVEEIGQGGMGEVYRAARADGQYDQQVAIKLVRAGMDSGFVLERFRNERQILAGLDHPNIARLMDGGTTDDGIPYLVMDLIEGTPIDEYCDAHHLNISERLKIFCQVCTAVQYAHQRLVIHRDIKPSNILVTRDGVPKLLDFGIAKIFDPSASVEVTLARPMTPEYASPEQIRGESITTATDVYSLGVALYQLLTGRSPYPGDTRTPHELARAICEMDPGRPSTVVHKIATTPVKMVTETGAGVLSPKQTTRLTPEMVSRTRENSLAKLSRRLRGDLDNIVLKALRKEPERRYASVEQFAQDIERHLEGLPVAARQDSWSYRSIKFIRRHRVGMAATVLVLLSLLGGMIFTLREARVAQANGQRAERRFNDVRRLANSLIFELHDSIKDLPGSTPARKLLVSRALEYLDSLSEEAKGDPLLQRELASAYERIGDVQGQPRQANLGDPAGAAVSYQKALAIREALTAADPNDMDVRRDLAPNYGKMSDLSWTTGDMKGAMENSRKALAVVEALNQAGANNQANRILLATYRMDYGYKQAVLGTERAGGLEKLRQGSAMLEQLVSEVPTNVAIRRRLGLSYSRTAEVLQNDPNDLPQAMVLYKKALATKKTLAASDPNNAEFRRLVAYDEFNIGQLLSDRNDLDGALNQDREALGEFQKLSSMDPANAQFRQDIGEVRGHIGRLLVRKNDVAGAIGQLRQALVVMDTFDAANAPTSWPAQIIAGNQMWLGKAHVLLASEAQISAQQRAAECREAETWLHKSLPAFEALRDHGSPHYHGAEQVVAVQQELARCRELVARK